MDLGTLDISPQDLGVLLADPVDLGVLEVYVDGTAPTQVLVDRDGNILLDRDGNTLTF